MTIEMLLQNAEECRGNYLENAAFRSFFGLWRRTGAENGSTIVVSFSIAVNQALEYGTNRMASSKTLLRFRCVRAEHSKYFWALISFAHCTAVSYWMGAIFFCRRASFVASSSRKSSLVPTRMMGTLGAWCSISGCHWDHQVSRHLNL